ncbi:aspartate/glutamate racemase family protein [Actinokineospora enzanensis]|uniref:aspartate/glutamate racemase family protein n=1 Tax=Actinokineospora enzanensis TaxID=155975 RepID=UPI000377B016|nr:amino acid racemase [Actinokineospora enzanensis]
MTRIGIVGGVGPIAAAHFYERLLRLSGASTDETYPAVVLVAERVPSRVAHLVGTGPSPLPTLIDAARRLERAGAGVVAIPSVTTHAYRDDIAAAVRVPVCDLLSDTGAALDRLGFRRPLILATEATACLRLLEPHLTNGTEPEYPDPAGQRVIDGLIDAVKRHSPAESLRADLTEWLVRRLGAEPDCVLLGCTELSVIAPGVDLPVPVLDVADVLARSVLDVL